MVSERSNSKEDIVGFNKTEAFLLFSFLINYDNDFKKKTDTKVSQKYPHVKTFWEHFNNFEVQAVNIDKVPENENALKKFSVIGGKQKSKIQMLLYHLRNAIAHGSISKDNKYVHFTDWNCRKKHLSAVGRIKNKDFEILLKIINNKPLP